jgi:toxin ParE1/3/4
MARFDITHEATEDLYKIWEYTVDTWSEEQANKYYSELIASFEVISAAPFNVGKSFDEIIPDLRAYHIQRHMIFYIIQNNERVLIVRVLHEKMDFTRHLNPFIDIT